MKRFFDYVVEDLLASEFFSDYKYRKNSYCLHKKNDLGCILSIELVHWTVNVQHKLIIEPIFGVRFNVLHKWYEKYCPMSLQDQKNYRSFFLYDTEHFIRPYEFTFNTNGENFDVKFSYLYNDIKEKIDYYYPRYSTLQGCFEMEILPVLEGKKHLPRLGAEWVFVDLALCKLVSPESYPEFKKLVMDQIDLMIKRREPNIMRYEGRFDEIFHYLETTDITKIK